MFFDEDNIYFNDININRDSKIFDIEEGFNKGNLFKNIYSKYKNHVYKLRIKTKKDEILYKIQMYTFALKDLNLYLDINPNDESMLKEFQNIKMKLNELKKEYTPLCIEDVKNDNKWTWINNPWPWDKGGN